MPKETLKYKFLIRLLLRLNIEKIYLYESYSISDEICEYFGVKIAMYFAWLGHYTQSLTVPAVVGFIFWVRIVF